MAVKTKSQIQATIDALPDPITRAALVSLLEDIKDSYQDYSNIYTTAQRDALTGLPTPYLIYNSDNQRYEFYDGSSWQGVGLTRQESPSPIKAEGNTDLTADESDDYRILVGTGFLTLQRYNGASWVNIHIFS